MQQLINDGFMTQAEAREAAKMILSENARELYDAN